MWKTWNVGGWAFHFICLLSDKQFNYKAIYACEMRNLALAMNLFIKHAAYWNMELEIPQKPTTELITL